MKTKTEAKQYPKIQRSKKEKVILFPDNITEIEKEDMEGNTETFYHYDLVKIPDAGQQVEDYTLFKKENYAALRRLNYGTWREQFEILQEQGFESWKLVCESVKVKYPKVTVAEK